MRPIALTDTSGRWFNRDLAVAYEDRIDEGGVSLATRDEHTRQSLYETANGHWILRTWSQLYREPDQYLLISTQQAACWLFQNHYDVPSELAAAVASLEL